MANEISVSLQLSIRSGNLEYSRSGSRSFSLVASAPAKAAGIASIGFAAHEALVMQDVATAGWARFENMDATNFVRIGVDSTGTFVPFLKLKPGEIAVCRLGTNAPYAKADTAAVKLDYEIFED
jgi:hypothetical protein